MIRTWIDDFFREPLQRVAAEQRAHLEAMAGRVDWRVAVVFITAAVMLTIQEYAVRRSDAFDIVKLAELITPAEWASDMRDWADAEENSQFVRLVTWAIGQFSIYVLGPVLVIKLVLRERVRDYGAKLAGMTTCWWAYLAMAAVMLPCVLAVSHSDRFLATYPFYRLQPDEPLGWRFIVWELLYAAQFVSLEFFFRGFMLHGARRRLGSGAIFAMMVPYCMIHFGKPPLETMGAIGAGVILGFMSLKTRSIWLGAALHIFVAWTMDAAALWQLGRW